MANDCVIGKRIGESQFTPAGCGHAAIKMDGYVRRRNAFINLDGTRPVNEHAARIDDERRAVLPIKDLAFRASWMLKRKTKYGTHDSHIPQSQNRSFVR